MINKIIFIILPILLISCCPNTDNLLMNFNKDFQGVWYIENRPNAILSISAKNNNTYSLKFVNEGVKWEGIGYGYNNQIIAIFRYDDRSKQGFVTFTLTNENKLNYISRNAKGKVNWEGYYLKYKSIN